MNTVTKYSNIDRHTKIQIKNLARYYKNNPYVKRDIILMKNEHKQNERRTTYDDKPPRLNKKNKRDIFRMALLKNISLREVLEKHYDKLYCYSLNSDSIIQLEHVLATHKNTVVLLGTHNNQKVVIKYYKSNKKDTAHEIDIYAKLQKMGCNLPWFSKQFMILGQPVLVMERLSKINKRDDIYKIGNAVIEQLSYLHRFGLHNDIKPDNIMKKKVGDRYEYYLIDYGGVSTEKMRYGYHRWIWTEKWTCQKKGEHNQISTPKHDFIELAYTLNYIHNECNKENFKNICSNCLGKYYDYVLTLENREYKNINYEYINKLLIATDETHLATK